LTTEDSAGVDTDAVALTRLLLLACVATAVVGAIVFTIVVRTNHGVPALLSAGRKTRGAELVARDFPRYAVPLPLAGPGQSLYVIAREPMHLADAAHHLDRPRYRLRAILLPLVAWALHPMGPGRGLVIAMWLVAATGVALCAFGAALLARNLGASARAAYGLAVIIPILPGSIGSLALTTPDALALGLALTALACNASDRRRLACFFAVLAVFAQPAAGLVLLGWTMWRGRRAIAHMVAIPAACAIAWWAILEVWFASTHDTLQEFSPLLGLERSMRAWALGDDRIAALTFTIATLTGLAALWRGGIRGPLTPAIVLQGLLIASLAVTSLAGDWNAIRATATLLTLAVTAFAIPSSRSTVAQSWARSTRLTFRRSG
jgi:hypothetical protein